MILRRLSVFLWALLVALGHATIFARPLTGQQIAENLRSQLSTASEIISPSEASYATDFTPRYNIAAPPTYIVAVKPALVTDVQTIVGDFIDLKTHDLIIQARRLTMSSRSNMRCPTMSPFSALAVAMAIRHPWAECWQASTSTLAIFKPLTLMLPPAQ